MARARELEGPHLSMSIAPRQPRRQILHSDHEHVGRISTQTTFFLLIAITIAVYALHWILLPFVVAGLIAFICTPLVNWLARRMRAPRTLPATAVFLLLLLIVALFAYLALPPLFGELTRLGTDLQSMIESLVRGAIGDGTIAVLGERMDATQMAQAAVTGLRNWLGDAGRVVLLGGYAFAGVFSFFLTLVLLFYFLVRGPEIGHGLIRLAPPMQRPLLYHIW